MKKLMLAIALLGFYLPASAQQKNGLYGPGNGLINTFLGDANTGKQVWVSEFDDLRVDPLTRLVGTAFVGNTLDPNFWIASSTTTGSINQSTGTVSLATGLTALGGAQLLSNRTARWVTGNENTFRTILKVGDLGVAGNVRQWGAYNSTDGFFFALNGTSLGLGYSIAGSSTVISTASWNNPTAFTLDTNYHIYEIRITYGDIHFYIDHVLVHTLQAIGSPSFYSSTLSLPVTIQDYNLGALAANHTLTAGVAFIMRTGQLATEGQKVHIAGAVTAQVLKYGPGRLQKVVINGSANTTTATLYDTSSSTTTANTFAIINTPTGSTPNTLFYDLPFNNGLTVTTAGSSTDITIIYE